MSSSSDAAATDAAAAAASSSSSSPAKLSPSTIVTKPKRPMTAYNFFFKEEHARIVAELAARGIVPSKSRKKKKKKKKKRPSSSLSSSDDDACDPDKGCATKKRRIEGAAGAVSVASPSKGDEEITFEDIGRLIGQRWNTIEGDEYARYKGMADIDSARYKWEMDDYYKNEIDSLCMGYNHDHQLGGRKEDDDAAATSASAAKMPAQPPAAPTLPAFAVPTTPAPAPSEVTSSPSAMVTASVVSSDRRNAPPLVRAGSRDAAASPVFSSSLATDSGLVGEGGVDSGSLLNLEGVGRGGVLGGLAIGAGLGGGAGVAGRGGSPNRSLLGVSLGDGDGDGVSGGGSRGPIAFDDDHFFRYESQSALLLRRLALQQQIQIELQLHRQSLLSQPRAIAMATADAIDNRRFLSPPSFASQEVAVEAAAVGGMMGRQQYHRDQLRQLQREASAASAAISTRDLALLRLRMATAGARVSVTDLPYNGAGGGDTAAMLRFLEQQQQQRENDRTSDGGGRITIDLLSEGRGQQWLPGMANSTTSLTLGASLLNDVGGAGTADIRSRLIHQRSQGTPFSAPVPGGSAEQERMNDFWYYYRLYSLALSSSNN